MASVVNQEGLTPFSNPSTQCQSKFADNQEGSLDPSAGTERKDSNTSTFHFSVGPSRSTSIDPKEAVVKCTNDNRVVNSITNDDYRRKSGELNPILLTNARDSLAKNAPPPRDCFSPAIASTVATDSGIMTFSSDTGSNKMNLFSINNHSGQHNQNYYSSNSMVRKIWQHRPFRSRRCCSRSPHKYGANSHLWNNNNHSYFSQESFPDSDFHLKYSSYGSSDVNSRSYDRSNPLNNLSSSNSHRHYNQYTSDGSNHSYHRNGYSNFNYRYQSDYTNDYNNFGRGRYKPGREDENWTNHNYGYANYHSNGYQKQNSHCPSHMGGGRETFYRGIGLRRGRGRSYSSSLSPRSTKTSGRNGHNHGYRFRTPPTSPLPHKWDSGAAPFHPPPYYCRDEFQANSLTVDVGGGMGSLEDCVTISSFCEFGLGGGSLIGLEELGGFGGLGGSTERETSEGGEGKKNNRTTDDYEGKDGKESDAKGEDGHVVHFHINPGTTVNFTNSEGEIQRVSGPATVRMVSTNSSPPIPLPVQMPPGHVVQQIVDETGTLQHVILSAQPLPLPVCSYNPTGGQGPPQFYSPPPPQGYMPSYQPPPAYSPVMSPPLSQPSPPPHTYQKNERNLRPHDKVRSKFPPRYQSLPHHHFQPQPLHLKTQTNPNLHQPPLISPKKEPPLSRKSEDENLNGDPPDSQPLSLKELLSHIKTPEVTDVGPYCATAHWTAPDLSPLTAKGLSAFGLRFEVFLNNSFYDSVSSSHISLSDLRPGSEYKLHLVCVLNDVRGSTSPKLIFLTTPTQPDTPHTLRLIDKKKNALAFKWNAPRDNGSKIVHYTLEAQGGQFGSSWTQIYQSRNKEFWLTKLQPQTDYRFRLSASNEFGTSDFSPEFFGSTLGLVPTAPDPPVLDSATVNSLKVAWTQRSCDDSFALEMDNSVSDYGFLPVFNGSETSFTCLNLTRSARYKFRLRSQNKNGKSPFSEIACYHTLADRPQPPSAPTMKGKHLADRLTLTWQPPFDHGGTPVSNYQVQIDKGSGFHTIYNGPELVCEATGLSPGTSYRFRCLAESEGGLSKWSVEGVVTTKPVVPGPCKPPRLLGKPKANSLQLHWGQPELDGGSPVTEFHVEMIAPDSDLRRPVYSGRDVDCTVASLLPGRVYVFLLRAANRVGLGAWSEPVEIPSGAGPPEPPMAPHLACKGPHVVDVSWNEPLNNGAVVEIYTVQKAEVYCPGTESSESSSTCGDADSELTFSSAASVASCHADLRGLAPATTYAFRVCASNMAGSSAYSLSAEVTTPAAPPAPVSHITSCPEATEVTLHWSEPGCHGDPITHYVIDRGEGNVINTPCPVLEWVVTDLRPETTYKFRIQAVNSVGTGPLSTPHKVLTSPLPPKPPQIELTKATFNSLRLKWGEGRNPDLLKYSLQMEFPNPRNELEFYQVYGGAHQAFKVCKLEEATTYRFRICATNSAGVGPYSAFFDFATTKAPPQPVKAPRISEGPNGSYIVEWCGVPCLADDLVLYRLQVLQTGKDSDYVLLYFGRETSYIMTDLESSTGYYLRVCGVRMNGEKEVSVGAYSSSTLFTTPKTEPVESVVGQTTSIKLKRLEWHSMTDHEKAFTLLLLFALLAFIFAYVLSPEVR